MREDDLVAVSRPVDLVPVEQNGRTALGPKGLAPSCSWRTRNYLFPTWLDELALRQARWSIGTSARRRSTPLDSCPERRVTNQGSNRLSQGLRDPRTYLLWPQRGVRCQGTPEVFKAMAAAGETCERSQLIVDILKVFGQLVSSVECRAGRVAQTFGKYKRIAERALQHHFPTRSIILRVEYL